MFAVASSSNGVGHRECIPHNKYHTNQYTIQICRGHSTNCIHCLAYTMSVTQPS